MKNIINGKMYNTETATCVASCGDEKLYRKKNGEWFLCGEGPHTWEHLGFTGHMIMPCSEEEARKWLAEYDFVDEYIEYFGEPEE